MEHRFSFRKIEESGRFADPVRFWVRYRACGTAGVMYLADGYRRKQFKAAASDSIYNDETRLFERKGKRPPDNSELCSRLNKVH